MPVLDKWNQTSKGQSILAMFGYNKASCKLILALSPMGPLKYSSDTKLALKSELEMC